MAKEYDEDGNLIKDTTEHEDDDELDLEDDEDSEDDDSDDVEVLQKRVKTLSKQKKHWRTKAKEAADARKNGDDDDDDSSKGKKPKDDSQKKPSEDALTADDVLAFTGAQVTNKDDIEVVRNVAKRTGMSISEALEDDYVVSTLKRNAEKRDTADATNKKTTHGAKGKVQDSQILKDAEAGKMPEPGSPEAEALYRARRGIK